MEIMINDHLTLEVCIKNGRCNEMAAHCHVIREGVRVALVWIDPISIEPGHSLEESDCLDVILVASRNRGALISFYEYQ